MLFGYVETHYERKSLKHVTAHVARVLHLYIMFTKIIADVIFAYRQSTYFD